MIQTEGIFVGGSAISAPIIGKDFNWTGGDGTYQVLDDGSDNWRIKFLSSGTFTPLKDMVIDVFLVGAGGGKGSARCGGGGAGYTTTVRSITLAANTAYQITIGAAGKNGSTGGSTSATDGTDGGTTSAFSTVAAGGKGSTTGRGTGGTGRSGDGGSGGGGYISGGSNGVCGSAAGGTDGGDGTSSATTGGKGQGTTTREFGETDGDLYASGGGDNLTATVPNSGNGGSYNVEPADGIVVIRQHKEVAA
jgi:hypothetical protein